MKFDIGQEEFLQRNRISKETWDASGCDWEGLRAIAIDHLCHKASLSDSAEFFARIIQRLPQVHSVRWRIKDAEHLLEKIVRKRAEKIEKYLNLTRENYFEIVTDLIGIRALHLFKEDCFEIDAALRDQWDPIEVPVVYVRQGDSVELRDRFQQGFDIKEHPAGYRSIHYIFSIQPMKRRVVAEVQVRTIFEEGWSEIDHRVRYPNFTDNALVSYFLTIFNRLAGSADEMGGFVKGLVLALEDMQRQVADARKSSEESFAAMEQSLAEIEKLKQQDNASKGHIEKLKSEINQMRRTMEGAINSNPASFRTVVDGNLFNHLAGSKLIEEMKLTIDEINSSPLRDYMDRLNSEISLAKKIIAKK